MAADGPPSILIFTCTFTHTLTHPRAVPRVNLACVSLESRFIKVPVIGKLPVFGELAVSAIFHLKLKQRLTKYKQLTIKLIIVDCSFSSICGHQMEKREPARDVWIITETPKIHTLTALWRGGWNTAAIGEHQSSGGGNDPIPVGPVFNVPLSLMCSVHPPPAGLLG